jgi:CBS domain containing-hemolysin-like protein
MDSTIWIMLGVVLALDLLLSCVRASLLNAKHTSLVMLTEKDAHAVNRTLEILERPRLRISMRLGVGLMHFLLAGLLLVGLGLAGINVWLIVGILAVSTLLTLSLEFILEGITLHHPEKWALTLAPVGLGLDILLTPLSIFLNWLLGPKNNQTQQQTSFTDDELRDWVKMDRPENRLEQEERKMIYSIFRFSDTLCREIMVPRVDLVALDAATSVQEAIRVVKKTGHSRLPVYDDSIDNIIGLLYAKDLLKSVDESKPRATIKDSLRQAFFVPESKKVDDLLNDMQANRYHMAIVVDEYGGTAGLVTLEDIMEEIVGEIRDEYDQGEELPYRQINPNEYILQGRVDVDTLNEILGSHFSHEDMDTLSGYIYAYLGSVPSVGETVPLESWNLTVESVTGRTIRRVRAVRQQPETEPVEK